MLPKVDQGRSTQLPPIGEGVLVSYIQRYRKLTPHSKLQNRGDPTSTGQHVAPQTPGKRAVRKLARGRGLGARREGDRMLASAENLKNRVRTLFGLFSIVSEPEGPKNLTAYAILKLWDHSDDSIDLSAPANR